VWCYRGGSFDEKIGRDGTGCWYRKQRKRKSRKTKVQMGRRHWGFSLSRLARHPHPRGRQRPIYTVPNPQRSLRHFLLFPLLFS
jgi:hypothetical protein